MVRFVAFSQEDAPEVEVLFEGTWCFGTLHEWRQDDAGAWTGWVRFGGPDGYNRVGTFDQADMRPAM